MTYTVISYGHNHKFTKVVDNEGNLMGCYESNHAGDNHENAHELVDELLEADRYRAYGNEPLGFENDGDALAPAGWGTDEDYGVWD